MRLSRSAGGVLPRRLAVNAHPDVGRAGVPHRCIYVHADFGLTINMINLFALVLAIGNAVMTPLWWWRWSTPRWRRRDLSPYQAVKKVIGEISGAVIAITLLMTAVCAGVVYVRSCGCVHRQFAITMATSIVISGFVAIYIDAGALRHDPKTTTDVTVNARGSNRFLDGFNWGLRENFTGKYAGSLQRIAHRRLVTIGLWCLFAFGIVFITNNLPSGLILRKTRDDLCYHSNASRFNLSGRMIFSQTAGHRVDSGRRVVGIVYRGI